MELSLKLCLSKNFFFLKGNQLTPLSALMNELRIKEASDFDMFFFIIKLERCLCKCLIICPNYDEQLVCQTRYAIVFQQEPDWDLWSYAQGKFQSMSYVPRRQKTSNHRLLIFSKHILLYIYKHKTPLWTLFLSYISVGWRLRHIRRSSAFMSMTICFLM